MAERFNNDNDPRRKRKSKVKDFPGYIHNFNPYTNPNPQQPQRLPMDYHQQYMLQEGFNQHLGEPNPFSIGQQQQFNQPQGLSDANMFSQPSQFNQQMQFNFFNQPPYSTFERPLNLSMAANSPASFHYSNTSNQDSPMHSQDLTPNNSVSLNMQRLNLVPQHFIFDQPSSLQQSGVRPSDDTNTAVNTTPTTWQPRKRVTPLGLKIRLKEEVEKNGPGAFPQELNSAVLSLSNPLQHQEIENEEADEEPEPTFTTQFHKKFLVTANRYYLGSSKYKGVCFNKKKKKWRARLSNNGKREFLGDWDSEVEAALIYDQRVKELYATEDNLRDRLNFPDGLQAALSLTKSTR